MELLRVMRSIAGRWSGDPPADERSAATCGVDWQLLGSCAAGCKNGDGW